MKKGDLVRWAKTRQIGVVIDMFGDLDPKNPWVQVVFQGPSQTTQWCKKDALVVIKAGGAVSDPSLYDADI
jgi:hypothetical protein